MGRSGRCQLTGWSRRWSPRCLPALAPVALLAQPNIHSLSPSHPSRLSHLLACAAAVAALLTLLRCCCCFAALLLCCRVADVAALLLAALLLCCRFAALLISAVPVWPCRCALPCGAGQERGVEVPVERIVTQEREVPVDRVVEKVRPHLLRLLHLL
jgi:hypothetical protein